jgi:hypothetical protein
MSEASAAFNKRLKSIANSIVCISPSGIEIANVSLSFSSIDNTLYSHHELIKRCCVASREKS